MGASNQINTSNNKNHTNASKIPTIWARIHTKEEGKPPKPRPDRERTGGGLPDRSRRRRPPRRRRAAAAGASSAAGAKNSLELRGTEAPGAERAREPSASREASDGGEGIWQPDGVFVPRAGP